MSGVQFEKVPGSWAVLLHPYRSLLSLSIHTAFGICKGFHAHFYKLSLIPILRGRFIFLIMWLRRCGRGIASCVKAFVTLKHCRV